MDKAVQMYEQRIQGRHMGMFTHGQPASLNTNKNGLLVVS
jgi:hypothetical protein